MFGKAKESRTTSGMSDSSLNEEPAKKRPYNPEPLSIKFVKPIPPQIHLHNNSGLSEGEVKAISLSSKDIELIEGELPQKEGARFQRRAVPRG